ncbi:uncharacterized protein LOC143301542 [Babylonia areolata]|uniref:uncharacterized protein LOC143301542 n=1 Tax=Babylonia areolata TaxID=304850 RepID=UPI003FD682DB
MRPINRLKRPRLTRMDVAEQRSGYAGGVNRRPQQQSPVRQERQLQLIPRDATPPSRNLCSSNASKKSRNSEHLPLKKRFEWLDHGLYIPPIHHHPDLFKGSALSMLSTNSRLATENREGVLNSMSEAESSASSQRDCADSEFGENRRRRETFLTGQNPSSAQQYIIGGETITQMWDRMTKDETARVPLRQKKTWMPDHILDSLANGGAGALNRSNQNSFSRISYDNIDQNRIHVPLDFSDTPLDLSMLANGGAGALNRSNQNSFSRISYDNIDQNRIHVPLDFSDTPLDLSMRASGSSEQDDSSSASHDLPDPTFDQSRSWSRDHIAGRAQTSRSNGFGLAPLCKPSLDSSPSPPPKMSPHKWC